MTSSSFDKMLSQYQGNLPNISDTNYTSDLDFSLTEEVNKEVDNLKEDYKQRTAAAVDMAERAATSKQGQIESLVGLIGQGKELHDYWEEKKKFNALYDSYGTDLEDLNRAELAFKNAKKDETIKKWEELYPFEKGITALEYIKLHQGHPEDSERTLRLTEIWNHLEKNEWVTIKDGQVYLTKEGAEYINGTITKNREAYLNQDFDKLPLKIQDEINKHLKDEFVFDPNSDLDLPRKLRLLKPTLASLNIQNGYQAQVHLEANFDGTFQSLLAVKKRLPGMETAMSYLDVMEAGSASEHFRFADMLLRDAFADYIAYNKELVDQIGINKFKNKVFPGLYERAQQTHKKLLNVSLSETIENNKKSNSLTFSARLKSEGINAIVGPNGYVSINELQLDGTTNNAAGIVKTQDALEYAVKNGYIKGRDLLDVIDDEFLGRDGKMTTLEKLKPEFYQSLRDIALKDIAQDIELDRVESVNDVLQQTDNLYKQAKDNKWSIEKIKSEAGKLQRELIDKHPSLSPGDSIFNDLTSLSTHGELYPKRVSDALLTLQKQEFNKELLSGDLIQLLPEGPLRNAWLEKAKKLGVQGLTKEDLEEAETEISAIVKKDLQQFALPNELSSETFRLAEKRSLTLFSTTYHQLMMSDNRPDTLAAKRDNKLRAMDVVRQALLSYNPNDLKNQHPIYGNRVIPKYQDITINEANIAQFLKSDEIDPLTTNLYWSDLEELAILNSIEAIKNGERIDPWFLDKANYFPSLTPRELLEKRIEATTDLRDETKSVDIEIGDRYHNRSWEFRLVKNPNAAKPVLELVQMQQPSELLNGLAIEGLDYTSVSRLDSRIPEFDPSQVTLKDLIITLPTQYLELGWNDEIGVGKYDMKIGTIVNILQNNPDALELLGGGDVLFTEEIQDQLKILELKLNANKLQSYSTLNSTSNKIAFISKDDLNTWSSIVSSTGNELLANDPFSRPDMMNREVAKVALQDLAAIT